MLVRHLTFSGCFGPIGVNPVSEVEAEARKVGSGGTGCEPRCVQSPCPAGTQGLLQTLGAEGLCDRDRGCAARLLPWAWE